jgi:hypothetical protein
VWITNQKPSKSLMEKPVPPGAKPSTPEKGTREEGSHQSKAADRIRPELNIEKWAGLWRPSHSPMASEVRTLEREYRTKDGTRLKASVEVGFSHLGVLTTEDQKTYYALVKEWEISGRSPSHVFFSVRGLARILHKKWGTNVITAITASLNRLRATPITWENAYFDADRRETLEQIETLNILSDLKIVRRKADGRVTKEAGYFHFNDFTLRNLLNRHTKPVLFETILRFRTDLAQLLYTHLDLIMADKLTYERRTLDLCRDLGLRGSEYGRVYERKRAFSKAIAELRGVSLTSGVVTAIQIERTRDQTDYKLTVKKGMCHPAQVEEEPQFADAPTVPAPADSAAREVVLHFHKVFHGMANRHPQSKEIAQATALVAQYGFARAKHVVAFAHDAAAKTKYRPQTFGGILQYAARAATAYDNLRRSEQLAASLRAETRAQRDFDVLNADIAEKRNAQAEARLQALAPEEYQNLHARVRTALLNSHWLDESSPVFQRVLHRRIIAEMLREEGTGPASFA